MIKNKHFPQLLKKYRMLIGVVCFRLCYRVILSPLIIRWQELNDKILVLERKFKKVTSFLSEEKEINAFYHDLSKVISIQSLESDITEQERQTQTFRFLNESAKKTGVYLKSITPHKLKIQQEYKMFRIDVNLESDLAGLVRFIYYIENSPQLLKVKDARVSSSKDGMLLVRLQIEKVVF